MFTTHHGDVSPQSSLRYVHWQPGFSMRTDGQTWRS